MSGYANNLEDRRGPRIREQDIALHEGESGTVLGIDSPGYLEPCKKLVDDLNEQGIKASLFFQQRGCTPSNPASDIRYAQSDCRLIKTKVPNKEFARELMKHGHSIGLQVYKGL